jgi:hypothetical protein
LSDDAQGEAGMADKGPRRRYKSFDVISKMTID